MAQAFSSFDTYLSAFVKKDNMRYEDVKQCIQSFIFGMNTPSRWGCVDTDTEVLTTRGFLKYNELTKDDLVYTWNYGTLELNPVIDVVIKPYKGVMHLYKGKGYQQFITPEHRMLVKSGNEYIITHSQDEFESNEKHMVPLRFDNINLDEKEVSFHSLVLSTIEKAGQSGYIISDSDEFTEAVQHALLRKGYTSYTEVKDGIEKIYINKEHDLQYDSVEAVPYTGIVWCPSVKNSTAVFRKNGCVFISGQCQPPFSNITLDWIVPDDLKDMPAIVGGKPQDFTYGDCKREMDMVNKAFMEVMLEGDANGRGFAYPMNLAESVACYREVA